MKRVRNQSHQPRTKHAQESGKSPGIRSLSAGGFLSATDDRQICRMAIRFQLSAKWLKASFEKFHGHMSKWDSATMDRCHTQLGLLIDFVTDCKLEVKP